MTDTPLDGPHLRMATTPPRTGCSVATAVSPHPRRRTTPESQSSRSSLRSQVESVQKELKTFPDFQRKESGIFLLSRGEHLCVTPVFRNLRAGCTQFASPFFGWPWWSSPDGASQPTPNGSRRRTHFDPDGTPCFSTSTPRTRRSTNSSATISPTPSRKSGTGSRPCRLGSSSSPRNCRPAPAASGPPGRGWPDRPRFCNGSPATGVYLVKVGLGRFVQLAG